MKTLLAIAALTSILTSSLLFIVLYSSSNSSNYTQNLFGRVSEPELVSDSVQDSENHSSDSAVQSLPGPAKHYTADTPPTHYFINQTITNGTTQKVNNSIMLSGTANSVTATEFKRRNYALPFKSWSREFVTEMIPTLRQNCTKLIQGDKIELRRTQLLQRNTEFHVNANYSTCERIRGEFLDNFYISQRERDFPLAFVLVVHTNAQQVIRFLKTIYRPHNHYCIHPDPTSGIKGFRQKFELLAKCLPNVILPSHITEVKYHNPSTIFRAQMSCFRDLVKARDRTKWRYVINLCGRELPLKTNRYIVDSLRRMNGTTIVRPHSVDQYTLEQCFPKVVARVSADKNCTGYNESTVSTATVEKCDRFLQQHNWRLYKSMAYNAFSFEFVYYFLYDHRMQPLQKWMLENCHRPEEHFYAMASTSPEAPGQNVLELTDDVPAVFKAIWYHYPSSPHRLPGERCGGRIVHQICILNAAELPRVHDTMKNSNVWFFNKYFMESDHAVIECVENELIRSNKHEFLQDYKHLRT